jgi:SSS family solute:Na+ symporter
MIARGAMKDLGGCLSLVLGVVSTQTYAQCIWSGATTSKARRGALLCAFFIPVIGAACTLVGLYMRGHYVTADELKAMQQAGEALPSGIGVIASSAQAFPAFILNHLPAWFGGLMLGALLINILGCGSGLMLGASTILVRDVIANAQRKWANGKKHMSQLMETRLSIVVLLAIAVVVANTFNGSFINDLGFLSLGLRAVAIIFPLSFALWLPGRFNIRAVMISMVAGTAMMLAAHLLALPGDAVFYGLATSLLVVLLSK